MAGNVKRSMTISITALIYSKLGKTRQAHSMLETNKFSVMKNQSMHFWGLK